MGCLKEGRNERRVCPRRERGGRSRGEPASAGDFRASQPCDPIRAPCARAGPRRKPASAQNGASNRGRQPAPSRSGTGRTGCAVFRGTPRERGSAACADNLDDSCIRPPGSRFCATMVAANLSESSAKTRRIPAQDRSPMCLLLPVISSESRSVRPWRWTATKSRLLWSNRSLTAARP
jgi:hypothetical protein